MTHQKTLTIKNFTDPMMGLSYESEPFLRKLETHFAGRINVEYVMSGLVRNVYDLVDPADLRKGQDFALIRYNARLAKIYESEESISGMPINMTGFQLFSSEHTSSIPLNLAYKAAQLADHAKADLFLYNLRYATIVECRRTLLADQILAVVKQTRIDTDAFRKHLSDGTAQRDMDADFALRRALGLRTLPAYLFEYGDRSLMATGVLDYTHFLKAIEQVTEGELTAVAPQVSLENIRALIDRHPLISPIEIREALGLRDLDEVRRLIEPLVEAGQIRIKEVYHGWFIYKL